MASTLDKGDCQKSKKTSHDQVSIFGSISNEISGSSITGTVDLESTPIQLTQTPFGTTLISNRKKTETKQVDLFKRPFPTPASLEAKKKRKVLPEDKFAEALDTIIQRECFPDLEKLKAQNAYLDAVANNDIQMMRELHTKYGVGRHTPSVRMEDTPSSFETPNSAILSASTKGGKADDQTPSIIGGTNLTAQDDDNKSVISDSSESSRSLKGKRPQDLGLNEFLNKYTSEDDQSFQDIINEGIKKNKLKYAQLYEEEERHQHNHDAALKLPSAAEQQSLEHQRASEVGTWTYKNRNAVMYIPDGVPYSSQELTEMAKKQLEVDFKNTRFIKNPYKGDGTHSLEPTPQMIQSVNIIKGISAGKVGFDGKEVNLGAPTPEVHGFKYVRTPSPTPGVQDSPFLTWGEIEGTPFRLDASDTPLLKTCGTPYRMIDTSYREKLAIELADKVSQRHRDKKQKTIEVAKSYFASPSPRPKTKMDRMSSMSPAAQKFAKNLFVKSEILTPRAPR